MLKFCSSLVDTQCFKGISTLHTSNLLRNSTGENISCFVHFAQYFTVIMLIMKRNNSFLFSLKQAHIAVGSLLRKWCNGSMIWQGMSYRKARGIPLIWTQVVNQISWQDKYQSFQLINDRVLGTAWANPIKQHRGVNYFGKFFFLTFVF